MENNEPFVQRLMQNLYRIARCRQAMFQDVLAQYGVTLHQFHLLFHIKSDGKVKVTELSDKMLVSMPTASRMINTLCELKLVSKKKDASDRRSTYLELTGKGEEILEQIHKQQMEMIARAIASVSEEDMEIFLKVTESVADQWMAIVREQAGHEVGIAPGTPPRAPF
jgi:DNA-binding MarR family transcriptional regulator